MSEPRRTHASGPNRKAQLQAALKATRLGPIFPARSKNQPRISNWPERATTDPEQIEKYWRKWPEDEIALVTGGGLLILDEDRRGALAELEQDLGIKLPPTREATTPRGGCHLGYSYPPELDIRNSVSKLWSGVDVKAWHGYVILPSPCSPDRRWVDDGPLVPAPPELLDRLTRDTHERRNGGGASKLAELLLNPPGLGERNDWLTQVAGHYANLIPYRDAYELHVRNAANLCEPPLDDDDPQSPNEVTNCINSIWKAEHVAGKSRLKVLDVRAMKNTSPPPVPWVVEPILARGCSTMISGRESRGKSMLALALAAAGGRAKTFSTFAGMICHGPIRSLYIDAENGQTEIHRRIHGLNVVPETLIYVEADGFDLRKDFSDLKTLIGMHGPDLLVLDSLRSLSPGLDENDSQQVEKVLRPVTRLTQQLVIADLILHHASRASGEYRGSTAIGAAVELGFGLAQYDEDPEVARRRRLACWKCRPAPVPHPRWIVIEPIPGGGISVAETEPYQFERERPRDEHREEVRAALSDEPLSVRSVATAVGLSVATAHRVLHDLKDEREAEQTDDGWRVSRFTPPKGSGTVKHPKNGR